MVGIDQFLAMTNGVNAAAPTMEVGAAQDEGTAAAAVSGEAKTPIKQAFSVAGAFVIIVLLAVILRHVGDLAGKAA